MSRLDRDTRQLLDRIAYGQPSASRSKWTDRLAILDLFLFGVVGAIVIAIGAVYAVINNLKAQSTRFKAMYASGYILLSLGGLLALASHWHWFGYRDSYAREANAINAIPAIMGIISLLFIVGGCFMILWSIFFELDSDK
jgi:hypothetical protein